MAGGGGVLERELLGATARARLQQQQRQRGEEANLILQLGTVVTSTSSLADHVIDSPPNSDPGLQGLAAAAATLQRSHVPRTITESRKSEDHLETKYRSNNHILPYQFVLQDHNYGAPPPPTPPLSPAPMVQSSSRSMMHHNHHHHGGMHLPPPPLTAQDLCGMAALATVADQVRAGSTSLSLLLQAEEDSRGSPLSSDEHDDPGPEGEETETAAEGEGDEDSVTRCICDFEHDDGYMICCDKCFVWQHVDCMGIDRSNIPDEYMCELCKPRRVDRTRARNLQLRKQMHNDTSSSDDDQPVPPRLTAAAAAQARRLSAGAGNPRKRQAKRETKKVVKRQRRDSAAVAAREQRVSERRANKKKEMLATSMSVVPILPSKTESKRIGTRRRSKNKQQADSLDEDTQEAWAGSNHSGSGGHQSPGAAPAPPCAPQQPQQLRQWIDNYEEAVTNHYSPELRARISSVKVNGVHSDFKVSNYTTQKCRTTMQENGLKVLISTTALHANQPIIEIRGKYMLAAQQQQARGGGPGRGAAAAAASSPYLLFYTLPKEGTEVCVDARTYGNDARFVRSSCKPNAEVRHCIEKGALHLYLVASQGVERHSEITIKHEETGPRSHCKDCPPPSATGPTQRNGMLPDPTDRRVERRRRGSRRTTSSEDGLSAAAAASVTATVTPVAPPPAPVVAAVATPSVPEPAPSPPAETVTKPTTPPVTTPTTPVTTPPAPTQAPATPVTRRGPKSPTKVAPTTPVTPAPPSLVSEDSNDGMSVHEEPTSPDKRKMTREERKMEAIMKAFERLEKAEQRRQETLARQKQRGSLDSQLDDDSEHHDTDTVIRRPKGRRTRGRSSSGASSYTASADEGSAQRQLSPAPNTAVSPRVLASPPPASTQPVTIDKQASVVLTNCLSFKFPKTKKVLMNEWLSKPSTETPVSPVKLEVCDEVVGRTGAAAAKKRWLRQAISEESEPVQCSSPNRASSPPGGDYVTPLKKRRLARESLSSEQSFTPPTTPASDKEEARTPDLEEAPAVTSTTTAETAKEEPGQTPGVPNQIHNAARCVEEAVKVLTSDTSFLEQIMKVKSEVKAEDNVQEKTEVEDMKARKDVEEVKLKEERPPSPPVLQRPCTPPPPPATIPAPPPPPLPVVDMKEVLTPASIKRKLSISEYRQRKKAEGSDKGGEGCDGAGTPSPSSQDDERDRSAAGSPADPLLDGADKTDGPVPGSMRWSSEPTLVERQRENLTERLKREFGLCLDDQEANKMAALANSVLGTVASKQQQQQQTGTASVTGAVAAAISTATAVGMVASATVAGVPNNCALLPPLPPLEPPSVKCADPHNIPLPPCSPPPLHDLLSEPALPPSPEDAHSKSAKPATSCNGPTKLSQSKSLSGAVQSKNQILSSGPLTNSTAKLTNKKSKKPIPTSTPSLQNNAIRQASSTATTT